MFNSYGTIFAADIDDKNTLLSTINSVSPYVEGIKIGNLVLLEYGLEIIKDIKKVTDRPLLIDIKFMDIQYIGERIAAKILSCGGDGIMIAGAVGADVIHTINRVIYPKEVFIFTQFTHMSGLITDEMADEYIDLALALKVAGIQIPATFSARISDVRERVGNKLSIISCGIGAQGAPIGSAIASGANYEIIGRYIYNPKSEAQSPAQAAKYAKEKILRITQSKKCFQFQSNPNPKKRTNCHLCYPSNTFTRSNNMLKYQEKVC